jgi:hypothetical protein
MNDANQVQQNLPGKTELAHFFPIQQKYASRYFCWSHMQAASFAQDPLKLLKKHPFCSL